MNCQAGNTRVAARDASFWWRNFFFGAAAKLGAGLAGACGTTARQTGRGTGPSRRSSHARRGKLDMLSALARTLRLPMQPPAPVRLMAKRAAQAPKPRDSAKVANLFKRGARGLFGGKMIQFGNIISFSNKKWPHPPPATTHAPAVVAGELPAPPSPSPAAGRGGHGSPTCRASAFGARRTTASSTFARSRPSSSRSRSCRTGSTTI